MVIMAVITEIRVELAMVGLTAGTSRRSNKVLSYSFRAVRSNGDSIQKVRRIMSRKKARQASCERQN